MLTWSHIKVRWYCFIALWNFIFSKCYFFSKCVAKCVDIEHLFNHSSSILQRRWPLNPPRERRVSRTSSAWWFSLSVSGSSSAEWGTRGSPCWISVTASQTVPWNSLLSSYGKYRHLNITDNYTDLHIRIDIICYVKSSQWLQGKYNSRAFVHEFLIHVPIYDSKQDNFRRLCVTYI